MASCPCPPVRSPVAGHLRVELQLYGLRVVAEAAVGGGLLGAAREPHAGPVDPGGTPELCLATGGSIIAIISQQ